ncbi:uncharacterized protein BXZ73DRAFT_52163, partial [Epithele typhae]|uniref:uncharacterized protein n=1 Tax=Epithele typhae TaxID=378194 RepID=UPI002008925F
MSVCRHWRSIVITCPTLWNRVHHHNPVQYQLFLERSESTSLYLHLRSDTLPNKSSLGLYQVLATHASRLRHLYLEDTNELLDVKELLSIKVPRLQCL